MASRLELLKEQFFTDDGSAVLSGGLLYTYIVGTTTPKATYTTALGDVAQANPVVLDSNGRIPSDLYGVGAYKIVIKDSAGTTIDTIPTVSGANSASFTTIGDYSGDFDAAITAIGATLTTLYIDDTATMSTAVTVPATCTVVLQKGGVIVQAGFALTFNGPLIVHGGTITNNAALTINGHFTDTIFQVFTSTGTVAFGSGSIGFRRPEWFYSGSGLYTTAFERCIVSNSVTELVGGKTYSMSPDGITNAANITGKNNWTLNGNGAILKFDDNVENGAILFIDNCDDFIIKDTEFDGNISGGTVGARHALVVANETPASVASASCNRGWISGCYIYDTQTGAIAYDASGILVLGSNDIHVERNTLNNTDVDIMVRQSSNVTISNNIIKSGGTSEAISLWGDVDLIANTNVSITGNVLEKQLQLAFVTGCNVTGNIIKQMAIGGGSPDNYAYIANDVVVSGNIITYRIKIGEQNGVATDITANDISIIGNEFKMLDSYGIRTQYKVHSVKVKSNFFKLGTNATAMISAVTVDGAAPTNVNITNNDMDLNGYTLDSFIVSDATPLYIKGNVMEGTTTNNGVIITTVTGSMPNVYIENNVMPLTLLDYANGQPKLLKNNITSLATEQSVASATSLTLYYRYAQDNGYYHLTGTTAVTSMTATYPGHVVHLTFDAGITMTDGNNLKLAGNFAADADDGMALVCDGTNWFEQSRSAN